jgi:hypothetical protein
MSKQFKVGDVAIIQHAKKLHYMNGEEVEIARGLGLNPAYGRHQEYMGYQVKDKTGRLWFVHPVQIRPKRPPRRDIDEVVSWESVGWMPMDVKLDKAIKQALRDNVKERA